jgi:hypothetical protein
MRTPRLVFVGDLQSRLTAIDVATGTSVWQYTAGPDAEIRSTLGGLSARDVICFGAGAAILCCESRCIVCSESPLLCWRPSGCDGRLSRCVALREQNNRCSRVEDPDRGADPKPSRRQREPVCQHLRGRLWQLPLCVR